MAKGKKKKKQDAVTVDAVTELEVLAADKPQRPASEFTPEIVGRLYKEQGYTYYEIAALFGRNLSDVGRMVSRYIKQLESSKMQQAVNQDDRYINCIAGGTFGPNGRCFCNMDKLWEKAGKA